jgi:hypothetical protein
MDIARTDLPTHAKAAVKELMEQCRSVGINLGLTMLPKHDPDKAEREHLCCVSGCVCCIAEGIVSLLGQSKELKQHVMALVAAEALSDIVGDAPKDTRATGRMEIN